MDSLFSELASNLLARAEGHLNLRFVIQPVLACFFAVRAGLQDAQQHRPPILWALAFHPNLRRDLVRQSWSDISRVFGIGVALDLVYQFLTFGTVSPLAAMVVPILLVMMPYLLVRAPVTRFVGLMHRLLATELACPEINATTRCPPGSDSHFDVSEGVDSLGTA